MGSQLNNVVPLSDPMSAQKLTTNDALTYLKAVKEKFHDNRAKYGEFVEVMRDFKSASIDTAGVIIRVKTLFSGYPELILGFNAFLPKGFAIKLQDIHSDKKPVDFTEVISFVNKVKARFQDDKEAVYKAFIGALNMYRMHNNSIQDVYQEVATVFRDHADLLEEFKIFLPDTSTAPQVLPPDREVQSIKKLVDSSMLKRHNLAHTGQKGFVCPQPGCCKAFSLDFNLRVHLKTHVMENFHVCPCGKKFTSDFKLKCHIKTHEKDDDKTQVMPPDRKVQSIKRERPHPSTAERDTSVDRPDLEHDPDRNLIKKEKVRKIDCDRRDHEKDVEYDSKHLDGPKCKTFPKKMGAETHQGAASISASSYNDNDAQKSVYTQEFQFCEKVKENLEPEAYQEFLKCLHIYSQEIITRNELKNLVNDMLQRCPDLMSGFSEFLEHCENIGILTVDSRSGKSEWSTDGGGGIWPTGRPSCC